MSSVCCTLKAYMRWKRYQYIGIHVQILKWMLSAARMEIQIERSNPGVVKAQPLDVEAVELLRVRAVGVELPLLVTRIFNEHGIQVSHSKVYQIQVQRDDLEAGRPNTRVIRPLPKQAQFHAVGKRGERYL